MVKNMIFFIIFLMGCSSQKNCNTLQDLKSSEIKQFINESKIDIYENIYRFGECKVESAIPFLVKELSNKKISHSTKYKGMSIRYVANIALSKITNSNYFFKQTDSEEIKNRIIQSWIDYIEKSSNLNMKM